MRRGKGNAKKLLAFREYFCFSNLAMNIFCHLKHARKPLKAFIFFLPSFGFFSTSSLLSFLLFHPFFLSSSLPSPYSFLFFLPFVPFDSSFFTFSVHFSLPNFLCTFIISCFLFFFLFLPSFLILSFLPLCIIFF